jgi:hypothetical protein
MTFELPFLGHAGFRLDVDEPAQSLVVPQFGQHGLGGDMPQGDSEDDQPPKHMHRVVVAALAPGQAEPVEQRGVAQSGEEFYDGL